MIIAHSESVGMPGPVAKTNKVAAAGATLLPLLVCKAPPASVLTNLPAVVEVTFTVIVQVPGVPAGIVEFVDKLTVVPPGVALTTPPPLPPLPQVVLAFGVGAITSPVGKVSMSGAVKVATLRFGLDSVMVRGEVPPVLMKTGLKPLASEGSAVSPPGNAAQTGTVIVFASVVTVPPNARALPVKFVKCPNVIPAASRIFPTNVGVGDSEAFAPSVVAPMGAQNTSEAQAPPARLTSELAPVVSAPPGLKM